jgi:hypothetical protein
MAILYLDIETAGNVEMERFLMQDARPPANYKSPEAIAKWAITEADKRLKRMPLDIDYARIVALGYAVDEELPRVHLEDEWRGLNEFWRVAQGCSRICGFNVLGFDIPIILRRSWVLGIKPTCRIDMRRYSVAYVIDLMQLLYHWGQGPGVRSRGLKILADMYGIENRLPDLDGSMVAEMDANTLESYCANDVRITRELAHRTRGWYWQ